MASENKRMFVCGHALPRDPFLRFVRAWNLNERATSDQEKAQWFEVALQAYIEAEKS